MIKRIFLFLTLIAFLGMLVLALLFRPLVVRETGMEPNLMPGDVVLVDRWAYGAGDDYCRLICKTGLVPAERPVAVGEVVLFTHPATQKPASLRVVGRPSDRVEVTDGVLHINGAPQPLVDFGARRLDYVPQGPDGLMPSCSNAPTTIGDNCEQNQVIETIGDGPKHILFDLFEENVDSAPIIVPPGFYYLLGDNRDVALDSRAKRGVGGVGLLPKDAILGQPKLIIFSFEGRHPGQFETWRGNRYLRGVR